MSKSKVFVGIALSFVFGVLMASKFAFPKFYSLAFLAVAVSGFAVFYFVKAKTLVLLTLGAIFTALGMLRLQAAFVDNQFQDFFDSREKLEGYIVEDPDVRIGKQMLTFQPKNFSQRLLITTSLYQDYFYGDWAVVEGLIKQPQNFDNFDYQGYLERFNITAVSQYPKILVLKNSQGNFVKYWLLKIKSAFATRISKFLGEPQNSLLLGILIGARKTLPQEVTDNFNATGTSHIVAISGYNISVIIGALAFLAQVLGRRWSFWLSALVIAGFVILTGASASVMRAALMGALLLISMNVGRIYAITPSLCLAAAGMLAFNPKILYWDVGFQLSFAATLGIVYLLPQMEIATGSWPKLLGVKSIVLATFSATLATLPLILLYFGRLSLVALVANVLILPMVPMAMLFGFLIALPFLSPGFALISNWLLVYILKITEYLARLPYSSLDLKLNPPWLVLMGLLPVVAYFLLRRVNKKHVEQPDNL